eukprot:m.336873 g.336873  ORF g.336873 m.336873 type:complete len:157 (-) comp17987_c0_seq1:27-497(-)
MLFSCVVSFVFLFNFAAALPVEERAASCEVTSYTFTMQNACGFESIHGLWPNPYPACSFCTNEQFDPTSISSTTMDAMKKYWPTCSGGGTNDDFWGHEWSKHGTCSGLSQEAYFSKALSLFSEYEKDCPSGSSTCELCFTPTFKYTGVCPNTYNFL